MRRPLLLCSLVAVVALGVTPVSAQSELDRARTELADAEGRITDLQAEADAATAAFHEAESELGRIELDITVLEDDVAELVADVSALEEAVAGVAIQQYTGVAIEGDLEAVSRPDVNESARAGFLVDYANGASTDVLDDYRAARARLAGRQAALAEAQLAQERTLADLTAAQDTVYASLEDMQSERDRIQTVVNGLEAEERARIQAEMAAAQAAAQAAAAEAAASQPIGDDPSPAEPTTTDPADPGAPPTTEGEPETDPGPTTPPATEPPAPEPAPAPPPSGPFVCPVAGPTSFTDTWGAPRGNGRTHKGVDMMAATGTPVVNPVSGTVEHRGNSVGGESFHLYGTDGNYYYGTHLSGYAASGSLPAGTTVGYVGATGNATTPHLHFEIHPGGAGNPVNPYPTVAQYC